MIFFIQVLVPRDFLGRTGEALTLRSQCLPLAKCKMSSFTYAFIHITAWTVSEQTNGWRENRIAIDEVRPGVVETDELWKEFNVTPSARVHKHLIQLISCSHRNVGRCLYGRRVSSVSRLSVHLDAANLLGKWPISSHSRQVLDIVPLGFGQEPSQLVANGLNAELQ